MSLDRIKLGATVRALHQPARDRGYLETHRKARQLCTGLTGITIAEHDSHGLCYEVKFPSGAVITYDREELMEPDVADEDVCGQIFAGAQHTGSDPTLRTAFRIAQADRLAAAAKKET